MATRIPPSLAWLIDKRARLDAELQKARIAAENAKRLLADLEELEHNLNAIDRALGLHELQIDTNLIAPKKTHAIRVRLPYGALTRTLLQYLRLSGGNGALTAELATLVATRHPEFANQYSTQSSFNMVIRRRLKNLAHAGVVERLHLGRKHAKGLWRLAEQGVQQPLF
jgi:hypothetical protein